MNRQDLLNDYDEKLQAYCNLYDYWANEGFDPNNIREVQEAYEAKEAAWKAYNEATE